MLTDSIYFWVVIIAIIGIIYYIRAIIKNRKYYERIVDDIMDGKKIKKSYHDIDYERITGYYKIKKKKEGTFFLDDITWNDLDMNMVFEKINNTITHMGESVLYNMLRMPLLNSESFKTRQKHINKVSEDDSLRRKIVEKLAKMEKGGESNILKILFENMIITLPGFGFALTMSLGLLFMIVFTIIDPMALFPAIILFIVNITIHYKNLKEMRIICDSVNESIKLVEGYKGLRKILGEILGELPRLNEKVFTLPRNPISFFQKISDVITEFLRMIFLMDIMHYSAKIKTIMDNKQDILEVYKVIGYIDSINSIIMYRDRLKYFSQPDLNEETKPIYKCKDVFHPLLEKPVPNSVGFDKSVILTGSNASGKSTFLKTAAINAILSQSIITSLAKRYKSVFYKVVTSIALNDSLKDGESYFIAEIKSLKRIFAHVNAETPILCIIDEILRGTNTIERISASSQVLLTFSQGNTMTIAATHDHELCTILEKSFDNYHFEEKIRDNNVEFDYKIKKGPSESKNAIKLLSIFEYKKDIVKKSEELYASFMKSGKWEVLQPEKRR